MDASGLMTSPPETIDAHAPVRDAIAILEKLGIRHLPVTGDRGELVGIVSERDIRQLVVPVVEGDHYRASVMTRLGAPVSQIMSRDVRAVRPDTDVIAIVELMLEHHFGAVPVVDRDGIVVGIVSYIDVLRHVARTEQRRAA